VKLTNRVPSRSGAWGAGESRSERLRGRMVRPRSGRRASGCDAREGTVMSTRARAGMILALPLLLAALALVASKPSRAVTLDFEDLGASLPIDGNAFYDGRSAYDPGDADATDFSTGGATFNNEYTDFGGGCCWQGFAYSQTTDTTTSGPGNQYSAVTGGGVGGSATYAVGFTGGVEGVDRISLVRFDGDVTLSGVWITNTTWAARSMLDGDGFAKQFGGVTGHDPDFLSLSITGLDAGGLPTGSVEFLLADYRFEDDALDYVVLDWTFVDLSSLGGVRALDFVIASSDTAFGFVNTPAYFALDDLQIVPEPGTGVLAAAGLVLLGARGRRRVRRA
jgi:hypothetical protein